jgi:hypothetical protein
MIVALGSCGGRFCIGITMSPEELSPANGVPTPGGPGFPGTGFLSGRVESLMLSVQKPRGAGRFRSAYGHAVKNCYVSALYTLRIKSAVAFIPHQGPSNPLRNSTSASSKRPLPPALLAHGMIPDSGPASLKGQPVKARGIENTSCRRSVRSIPDAAGDGLFASGLSQHADKALFHRVMNVNETHDGHIDATLQGGGCCYFCCLSRVEGE